MDDLLKHNISAEDGETLKMTSEEFILKTKAMLKNILDE